MKPTWTSDDGAVKLYRGDAREVVGTNEDRLRRKPNGMKTPGATAYQYSQTQQKTDASITAPATDAAKEFSGWGTAISPAHEPICVAMKPLDGTFAHNAQKHGVAGLNIDGARIPTEDTLTGSGGPCLQFGGQNKRPYQETFVPPGTSQHPAGRWPKNVILDDSEEVAELFPQTASGDKRGTCKGNRPGGFGNVGAATGDGEPNAAVYDDSGSASRYFFCAKAGKKERRGSAHPTVKPLTLIEYLCRLTMTPTGGICLDPFLGSGTTAEACIRLGRPFIGIELDPAYFDDAVSRVKAAMAEDREQPTLFDMKPEQLRQDVLF